jgi:sugar lactone lactonase YvrE
VRGFPSPGDHPEGLAWDGRYLWCNNHSDGTLYKLDPADGRVVARFSGGSLPATPEGLAWDGEHIWTCDLHTALISKLRETTFVMLTVAQFPVPRDAGPPIGLCWDGRSLWLTCWAESGLLFELDPERLQVRSRKVLPVDHVEDLAWDGRYLWSADWLDGVGFAIDPATGDTLHTYRTPGPNPVGHAWDGTHLWVGDTTRDSIWALDISAARTPVRPLSWAEVKRLFRRLPGLR